MFSIMQASYFAECCHLRKHYFLFYYYTITTLKLQQLISLELPIKTLIHTAFDVMKLTIYVFVRVCAKMNDDKLYSHFKIT